MPRVLLIGLDCVPPLLAFERYGAVMPHLHQLIERGCHGPLRSSTPPITVPAWASMLSGYDPGELGVYGFRNRTPGSYELQLVHSHDVERPWLWERMHPEQRACVLFVPPSYPPRPLRGELVSCFLTPGADVVHTHPPELADELSARFGPYQPDVEAYRTDDLPKLLTQLYAATEQRFNIAEHLLRTRRPDFTALVEIGPDRFHHAFWAHIDPDHPRHDPDNPHRDAGVAYYAYLDQQIGRLLAAAGPDTNVLVVSDHGARPLHGCFHINQWLIQHGYLRLRAYPEALTPWSQLEVDWAHTRAFAEGGYYARVILNVRGREPHGCVAAREVEALRTQLTDALADCPGPRGERLTQRIVRPEACYRQTRGLPPDLMLFCDDLNYRASAAVGGGVLYSPTNDTGPDSCNHDWDGIFVLSGPGVTARGPLTGLELRDVAVTALSLLDVSAGALPGRDRSGAHG